ncbi:MAG: CaiB/BaiF CoA-transferase family protein [Actinomycetota bacterium]
MADSQAPAPTPLAGIKVLDLSRVFAGPVAGRILSDLGADVVKVEPPEGDITRLWGRKAAGLSTYYVQQNVGKRNVSIDLRADGGPELVRRLVAESDIVIENFRPGVMARHGLDYESLRTVTPDLVMVSISGFGQTGPEAGRAAYAPILHGEAGAITVPEVPSEARDVSFSAADVLSGMHGVIGLLAALRVRDQTGIGQHIDIAMMEVMTFSSDASQSILDDAGHDPRGGQVFDAVGGPILLSGEVKWFWHQLSTVHGLVDSGAKDRPVGQKKADRWSLIEQWMLDQPDRSTLTAKLDEANLAWGNLRQLGEVLTSPTIEHRNTVATIDDRDGGTRRVIRSPYVMSASPTREPGTIAVQGEHNYDVLGQWLGLSLTDVDELLVSGVLRRDEWAERRND